MSPEQEEFLRLMRADSRRSSTELCSSLVHENPEWMALVWQEIGSADYPYNFRAARVLDLSNELHPPLGEDFLQPILDEIQEMKNEGIVRQMLRMLARNTLSEDQLFSILDFCMKLVGDPNVAVALKVYSMELVLSFCSFQPLFKCEFESLLLDQFEHQKPAFKSRARHTLKKLNELPTQNV